MDRLLRIPHVGGGVGVGDYILVHVASSKTSGVDYKIIATENEHVFQVLLEHNHTSKLRQKNSPVNEDEWERVFSALLLGTTQDIARSSLLDGVEAVGRIEKAKLTIIIQRRIQAITQRLGSIVLPETKRDEDEPDLFDWCGKSILLKDNAVEELERLRKSLNDKDVQIKKLGDSLAELADLKSQNDSQMLEKFSLLLNEKKLKIRDQQRLLARSKVDAGKVEVVEESRTSGRLRPAGSSRKGKRKAGKASLGSADESDAFEKMDVDQEEEGNSEQERQETPDRSEETASEDAGELVPSPQKVTKKVQKGKAKAAPESTAVPPKRELPFAMKPMSKSSPTKDSETESDNDDEL